MAPRSVGAGLASQGVTWVFSFGIGWPPRLAFKTGLAAGGSRFSKPVPNRDSGPTIGAGERTLRTVVRTFRAHARISLQDKNLWLEAGGIEPPALPT